MRYVGALPWNEFEEDLVAEFETTPGRINHIKDVLRQVGPEQIRAMSAETIQEFWVGQVMSNLEAYGLNGGTITGLCHQVPLSKMMPTRFGNSHALMDRSTGRLTEYGIRLFQKLAAVHEAK